MNALGKQLLIKPAGYITFNEFTMARCLILMKFSFLLLLAEKDHSVVAVASELRLVLLIRCLIGFSAFQVTALASKLLPLSIYTLITSTSPLMTAIL